MTAIGGFLELETPRGSQAPWHTGALALTSGRSCLRAILEATRPRHAFVPFYICDSALEPFRRLEIPFEFYGLTRTLDADRSEWPSDGAVLVVNYFDLKRRQVDSASRTLGARAIIDDTQAFFRRGREGSFSFNSARKFFGVPDGAFAYGPGLDGVRVRGRNDSVPADHLTTRRAGDLELAYRQYQRAESQVSCELLSPSVGAQEVLVGVAYDEAFHVRRRNFMQLHDCLGELNALSIDFSLDADAAPLCYPFLPSRSLHEALWHREIFAPRLWPDIAARTDAGFAWERDLAVRLLPLPIDHRYDSDDMQRVADVVREVSR
jgi:hypothetical protein